MSSNTPRELLANLLKRREELRLESEALEKLIQTYQTLMMLDKEAEVKQLDLWKARGSRAVRSAYVSELMDKVRLIVVGEGRPLSRGELVRRLESEGYLIDGNDKAKVLGTNIWRSKQFQHFEGQGYWPKDVPLPRSIARNK